MKKLSTILILALIAVLLFAGCSATTNTVIGNTTIPRENNGNTYTNPAVVSDGLQTVTTKFSSRSYAPVTLQVGVPVKWTIQMDEKDLNSCNNEIIIPKYDIDQKLSVGETVVEFTPDKTGTIPYSCWMGMIRSSIVVVDDLTSVQATTLGNEKKTSESIEPLTNKQAPKAFAPAGSIATATVKANKATVDIKVVAGGYEPSVVIVQRDVETEFRFDVQSLSCALDIVFPQQNDYFDLTKEPVVTVTPTEDFDIQCTMGMYGVTVLVVDDIASQETADLIQTIKDNPQAYSYEGSGCCSFA